MSTMEGVVPFSEIDTDPRGGRGGVESIGEGGVKKDEAKDQAKSNQIGRAHV